ncbi:MAG: PTS sugar transporter subunit IIA [Candidatus Hydrogenedentota bacterium]|nr:MAG: PTS sugar transporter subunit IIA [Candidatus Hydrogenedentota bacterium]
MKLSDLLMEECIKMKMVAGDKRAAIEELVDVLVTATGKGDREAIIEAVWNREELMSTGIGQGIAIPHAKTNAVGKLYAVFGKSEAGIDFAALDNRPVHIFFLLVAPEDQSGPHVKALARISRLLKHSYFRTALLEATSPSEVLTIIREEELKNS